MKDELKKEVTNEPVKDPKKKIKRVLIGLLFLLAAFSTAAAYYIFSPIKITPVVAEISNIEDMVVMMQEDVQIMPAIKSDVELDMVPMPATKEIAGLNFKATYDIQEFTYEVTYSTETNGVFSVDEAGVITPLETGKGTLTVTAGEMSEDITITVKEYIRPETLPEEIVILIDEEAELVEKAGEYQILNTDFSVIDTNIVSVNEEGVVTGLNQGETTVAAILSNGESGQTVVKVLQPVLELEVSDKTVNVGSTVKSNVKLLPDKADYGTALTYTSSDTAIAMVNEKGIITGKAEGKAIITVKTENGVEKSFNVSVKKVVVQTPQVPSGTGSTSSSGSQTPTGSSSGGSQPSGNTGPTVLSDAEIAKIVAAGNAAFGDRYWEGANSYGSDRNVITVNKSYDQVYNEVMALVNRTYSVGRVFNVGSTIIVAYSF